MFSPAPVNDISEAHFHLCCLKMNVFDQKTSPAEKRDETRNHQAPVSPRIIWTKLAGNVMIQIGFLVLFASNLMPSGVFLK